MEPGERGKRCSSSAGTGSTAVGAGNPDQGGRRVFVLCKLLQAESLLNCFDRLCWLPAALYRHLSGAQHPTLGTEPVGTFAKGGLQTAANAAEQMQHLAEAVVRP
jgi:hypothetical protein